MSLPYGSFVGAEAYGFALLGGAAAYGLFEAGAGDPEALEAFDLPPKREAFFESRSPSPLSLFLRPNGMIMGDFRGNWMFVGSLYGMVLSVEQISVRRGGREEQ